MEAEVLFYSDGKTEQVGTPTVDKVKASLEVVERTKSKKN